MTPPFSNVRNKAKAVVQSSRQVELCLLCSDRKRLIEQHHSTVKNPVQALKIILRCPTCRPILFAINQCAKEGHYICEGSK